MSIVLILGFVVVFGAVQMLLSRKARSALISYLPLAVTIVGLLFCLAVYANFFETTSPSVIAENRYFARFLCIPIGSAFVGSLSGLLLSRLQVGKTEKKPLF